jgi:hypothetical protein
MTYKLSLNGGGFNSTCCSRRALPYHKAAPEGSSLTNHALIVGAGASAVNFIGPDASTTNCLISGGLAADPAFGPCPGGGSSSLDSITAAGAAAAINNGDFAIRWNWQPTTASRVAIPD